MDDELDRPLIFIFNFGRVLSVPDVERLAHAANADWEVIQCQFTHENPHAKQVRHSLKKAFDEIMQYAETGVPVEE